MYQDVKPANVMIGNANDRDSVFLVDLGCLRTYVDMKGGRYLSSRSNGNVLFVLLRVLE